MIRSMLRGFVLLVLLAATLVSGVFVGHHYPGIIPGPSADQAPRLVLRDALTEVSELVLVETAVKQTVTREIAGTLGGVSVRVDTVGIQRLGIDLNRARVVAVDHDARAVTVELPPVEVLHAGLDHGATLITAHSPHEYLKRRPRFLERRRSTWSYRCCTRAGVGSRRKPFRLHGASRPVSS